MQLAAGMASLHVSQSVSRRAALRGSMDDGGPGKKVEAAWASKRDFNAYVCDCM